MSEPPSAERTSSSGIIRDPSGQPPQKRRRTAQACAPCRQKKSKCDGRQPICKPCESLEIECSYPLESAGADTSKVMISRNLLEALESRIKFLEESAPRSSQTTGSIDQNGDQSSRRAVASSAALIPSQATTNPKEDVFGGIFDPYVGGSSPQQNYIKGTSPANGNPNLAFSSTWTGEQGYTNAMSGQEQPIAKVSNSVPVMSSARDTGNRGSFAPPLSRPTAASTSKSVTFPTTLPTLQTHSSSSGAVLHSSADGMGVLPPMNNQPNNLIDSTGQPPKHSPGISEFYGETSGIIFHSLLLDTILPGYRCLSTADEDPSAVFSGPSNVGEATGFLGLAPRPPNSGEFFAMIGDLPTKAEARSMWQAFETRTLPIYPFLEMETLKSSYEGLLDEVGKGRFSGQAQDCLTAPTNQPVLALHFLVFALVQSLTGIDLGGKEVYRVSLHLLRKHLDWPHSVVKVQALLMGTLLMQGVDCPSHGWDVLGYAIRSGYAVGLHDPRSQRGLSPEQRETVARVWWACLTLDRLLTISLGRPSSISTGMATLPMPVQRAGESHVAYRFLVDSIQLYSRLSVLIKEPPYLLSRKASATGSFIQDTAIAVAGLEEEYAEWADSIDPALRIPEPNGPPSEPLAYVLALRGCTARLLLHRPIVLGAIRQQRGLQSRPASPVRGSRLRKQQYDQQGRDIAFGISVAAVIETSVLSVRLLKESSASAVNLSAPWYQLFYAVNSFMSLIATFLLDLTPWSMFIKTPSADIIESVTSAREIVQNIAIVHEKENAKRALWIMDRLMQATVSPNGGGAKLARRPSLGPPVDAQDVGEDASLHNPSDNVDFASLFNASHGSTNGGGTELHDLPHLDFQALYQGLQDYGVPPGMGFNLGMADWNLGGFDDVGSLGSMNWQTGPTG